MPAPDAAWWFPLQLLLVSLSPWVVYGWALTCGFVSDDHLGIETPPITFKQSWHFHKVVDLCRWAYGKVAFKEKHPQTQELTTIWRQSSVRHHRLNLWLGSGVAGLLYLFLRLLVSDSLALYTTLLFIAHPLGAQCLAWISGIGYLMSLTFALLALQIAHFAYACGWLTSPWLLIAAIFGFSICYLASVCSMFAGFGVILILAFLGYWVFVPFALILMVVGAGAVLLGAVQQRKAEFEKQKMGACTKFYARKLVVVLKTLAYHVVLSWFPKRLGLYHDFCLHYELPKVEQEDAYFWGGVGFLMLLGGSLWLAPFPVAFGMVWFVAFLLPFLNWITANQFVSERYGWMPAVGTCLIATYAVLMWCPQAYWLLLGVALMRTWAHLPTYLNEVEFYRSNVFNFPKNEMAWGNLGVSYLHHGLQGMAMDSWKYGTLLNPDYDVNWYNMANGVKGQNLLLAKTFLEKAVSTPGCHFPEMWGKELADLNHLIQVNGKFQAMAAHLQKLKATPGQERQAADLEQALLKIQKLGESSQAIYQQQAKELAQTLALINRRETDLSVEKKRLAEFEKSSKELLNLEVVAKQQIASIEGLHAMVIPQPPPAPPDALTVSQSPPAEAPPTLPSPPPPVEVPPSPPVLSKNAPSPPPPCSFPS